MIEKLRHPWRQNFQAALYFQLFFKMSEKFADADLVDNSIVDQEQRDVKRLQIRSLLRGAEGVLGCPSPPPPPPLVTINSIIQTKSVRLEQSNLCHPEFTLYTQLFCKLVPPPEVTAHPKNCHFH